MDTSWTKILQQSREYVHNVDFEIDLYKDDETIEPVDIYVEVYPGDTEAVFRDRLEREKERAFLQAKVDKANRLAEETARAERILSESKAKKRIRRLWNRIMGIWAKE